MALIASKGTLDWAYPPFILASTAAAMEMEVAVFFTFYGLTLLKKDIEAKKKLSVDFQKELENLIVEWNKKFQALKNARVDKNNFEKKIEKKLKQEPNKK